MAHLQPTPRQTYLPSSRPSTITFTTPLPDFEGTLSLHLEGDWAQRWCSLSEGRLRVYASQPAAVSRPFTPQRVMNLSVYDSIETSHSWGLDSTGHFEIRLASMSSVKDVPPLHHPHVFPRYATSEALCSQIKEVPRSPVKSLLPSSKSFRKNRPALTPLQPHSPLTVIPKGCFSADGLLNVVPKVSTWSRLTGRGRRSLRLASTDSSEGSGHDSDVTTLDLPQLPHNRRHSLVLRAANANDMLRWTAVISPLLVEARPASHRSFSLSPSATALRDQDCERHSSEISSPQDSIVGTLMEEAGYNARRRRTASAEVASRRAQSHPPTPSNICIIQPQCEGAARPKRRLSRIASGNNLTLETMDPVEVISRAGRFVSNDAGRQDHLLASRSPVLLSLSARTDLLADLNCATPTNSSVALWQRDCATDLLEPVSQRLSQHVDIIPVWQGSPMVWERRRSSCGMPSVRPPTSRTDPSLTATATEGNTDASRAEIGLGLCVAPRKAPRVLLAGEANRLGHGEGSASTSPDTPAASSLASATSMRSGSDYFSSVVSSAPTSPLTPSVFGRSALQNSNESARFSSKPRVRTPATTSYKSDPLDASQYEWLTIHRVDQSETSTSTAQPSSSMLGTISPTDSAARSFNGVSIPFGQFASATWATSTAPLFVESLVDHKANERNASTAAVVPFGKPAITSRKLLEPIEMMSKLDEISRLDPSAAAQARQALYNSKTNKIGLRRPAMPPRAWTTSAAEKFQTASVQANELPLGLASPFVPKIRIPSAGSMSSKSITLKLPRAGGPFECAQQPIDFFQLKTTAGAPTRPSRRRVATTNGALLPLSSSGARSTCSVVSSRASTRTSPSSSTSNEDIPSHLAPSPLRFRHMSNGTDRIEGKEVKLLVTPATAAGAFDASPKTPPRTQRRKENQAPPAAGAGAGAAVVVLGHPPLQPPLKSFFNDDDDTDDADDNLNTVGLIEDEDARYVERSYLASRGLLPMPMTNGHGAAAGDETFGRCSSPFSR